VPLSARRSQGAVWGGAPRQRGPGRGHRAPPWSLLARSPGQHDGPDADGPSPRGAPPPAPQPGRAGSPPVAASTLSVGCTAWSGGTRATSPGSSGGIAQRAPVGRRALSHGALATAIPTTTWDDIPTPDWPGLAGYGREHTGPRCGRWEERAATPPAPLQSRCPPLSRAIAAAYELTGILPRHSVKIQCCQLSPAAGCYTSRYAAGREVSRPVSSGKTELRGTHPTPIFRSSSC
jgi:hypothetical protein